MHDNKFFSNGYNSFLNGDYKTAIFEFNKIPENKYNHLVWYYKGYSFLKLYKMPEALFCFEQVVSCTDRSIFNEEKNFKTMAEGMIERINETIAKLSSMGDSEYITGFVNRYGKNYSEIELVKLKDLLKTKDNALSLEEINYIITEELDKREFNDFKFKMFLAQNIDLKNKSIKNVKSGPKTLENCIDKLLEVYGENYENKIDLLEKYFDEQKIKYERNIIEELIELKKENNELSIFEKELLESNNGYTRFFNVNDLDLLDGYEFENFLKILFEEIGYEVENTPLSGDQGADLVLNRFGDKIVVQAKRYNNYVTNKAVQEVVAAISHYKANKGIVVTNNKFTKSALELAKSNNIMLIDRYKLKSILEKHPIPKNKF